MAVLVVAMARAARTPTPPRDYRPVTFVMMAPLPIPHEPTPALEVPPMPAPERAVPELPIPVPVPKPDEPPPAPKPAARSEPAPAPPEPPRPAPPVVVAAPPAPVKAPPPPVTVGLFASSAPTVHETEPVKTTVRTAGFDAPSPIAKAGETKSLASVGAFDQPAAPPAKVARAGAIVESAGFGSARADMSASPKQVAEVRPAGFDPRPAPPTSARVTPPPERVDVPVEIVFKPAPVYTEEARKLKLEGDVLLDVEFAATGSVSVLQVVRGLGHGLDEAAARAATQIKFKPAQAGGRPISFRTTVHIVFRLA
jgi:TonB family protein